MRSSVLASFSLAASIGALLGFRTTAAAQNPGAMVDHPAMQSRMSMDRDSGVTALLTGPMGTRSPNGTVTVTGRTVRVDWSGDQPGSTRPWFVYRGSCTRDEGVVGAPSAYTPIAVDNRGAGTGTATLPAPLAASAAYVVAVRDGAPGATQAIIACGPIGTGGMRGDQMAGMDHMTGMSGMGTGRESAKSAGSGMAGMDHSMMNMPGMQTARGAASMPMGASDATSMSASMMALHQRMMADPVIHRRVMHDPTMRRMLEAVTSGKSAEGRAPSMSGRTMSGMSMPGNASGSPSASKPSPTARAPARKRAKPSAKKGSMPGMVMPGMNDGSMKGMPGMGGKP